MTRAAAAQTALIVLAAVATLAALQSAQQILAPLTAALILGVVLAPLSDAWTRMGLPVALAALLSLVLTVALLGGLGIVFQPIVARLVDLAPRVWDDIQVVVEVLRDLGQTLSQIGHEVSESLAETTAANAQTAASSAPDPGAEVDMGAAQALPTLTDALMMVPSVGGQILIFAGALYFFLLTRAQIYHWFATAVARRQSAEFIERLYGAERRVSRYFLTITLVNATLGLLTAGWLLLLGVPDAILLGLVAFLLNFVLYLGPAIFVAIVTIVGIGAADGVASLLPALGFVVLNLAEGQFITPYFVGRQMHLNPLLVFVALVLGVWLWGALGAIVALPLLLWALAISNPATGAPRTV